MGQIGTALLLLRTVRGKRQAEVAETAGIGASHLSLIENGKRDPSLRTLDGLCSALGVRQVDVARIAEDPARALGVAP